MKAITLRYTDEQFKQMQEVKKELNEVWERMVYKAVMSLKANKVDEVV